MTIKLATLIVLLAIFPYISDANENVSLTTDTSLPSNSKSDIHLPTSKSVLTDVIDIVLALYKDDNNTVSNSLKIPLSRAVKASTSTITSLSFGKQKRTKSNRVFSLFLSLSELT